MPSLLLTVFILQLFLHLVDKLGSAGFNELLWVLYNKIPNAHSKDAQESIRLKREVLKLKTEMNGVSAQDNFTRWAKLRRQHDKAVQQYEKSSQAVQSSHSTFDSTLKTLRFALTTGVRLLLQFWYSKRALFWLPQGWVPSYVEWILSFPRAPMGSVSIQVWGIACASVIAMCSEAMMAAYNISTKNTEDRNKDIGGGRAKGEPMVFGAGGEKKEL